MASKKRSFRPNQTIYLHEEYRNNPEKMINDLCFLFTIEECRKMLWMMMTAFVGSEKSDGLNREQRADYLFFYEIVSALIEASYLIDAKEKK